MKVQDLLELLIDCDENAEVRLVSQPDRNALEYHTNFAGTSIQEGEEVVYIVEGRQIGYLSREDRENIGIY